jgi:transposase
MDAMSLDPQMPLPDDVPTLQALVRQLFAELAQLRADHAALQSKLDQALRHRFGRRSERRPRRDDHAPPPTPAADTGHGRAALPAHLERREVVHDLTEAEKLCPCCGRPRLCIGTQTAEQLDLEPAHFFVRRTVKKSYACHHCDPASVPPEQRLVTAGPPQVGPLAKGLCGPGLLAHAITAKFADHTPLHRLAGQLSRSGVTVARSTLGDWLAAAAELLTPLVDLMHRRLLQSRVIHADDTPVRFRVPGGDRARTGHLWVCIGDADFPYTLFDFTANYKAAGPQQFLRGYHGYLQADALAQYEGLYADGSVQHVCCWAHARRKFVAALDGGDARAEEALALIRQLYGVERDLPALLGPSDEPEREAQRRQAEEQRRGQRQRDTAPLLAELRAWLEHRRGAALPKSPLGQAITYAVNHWAALCRYLDQGYLSIDNNLSERTLRAIALGRNNWIVVGSVQGGHTAAVLYSVVSTCKHLGLDPFVYLREALPALFALGAKPTAEQMLDWLPDRWHIRRARASPLVTASAS